jgi:5-methylcytosine-specific restriction endonuclease McrA
VKQELKTREVIELFKQIDAETDGRASCNKVAKLLNKRNPMTGKLFSRQAVRYAMMRTQEGKDLLRTQRKQKTIDPYHEEILSKWFKYKCVVCLGHTGTIHEIVPRSARPTDWWKRENRVPLCAEHHRLAHEVMGTTASADGLRKRQRAILELLWDPKSVEDYYKEE